MSDMFYALGAIISTLFVAVFGVVWWDKAQSAKGVNLAFKEGSGITVLTNLL
jgi:hypothetical protein